jgi:hypothetical protein
MADKSNELSGKCGSCRRKVIKGILCDNCNWWFHWECPNTTLIDVDVTKSWFSLTCKQTRTLRDQEETILYLQRELALAYDQIVKLKAENSSSIKCNCSSKHWTVVKAKSQRRNKSLCSTEDLNFNVELSNKFEALTMSEPAGVAQLKKKEDGKLIFNRNNSSNSKCNTKKVLLLGSSHGRGLRECLHSILW